MASAVKVSSVRRLVHDLREVLENPLPDVSALPLEDDLYVWHGNVRSSDGALGGCAIHFVLLFPDNYPAAAPECRLYTPVPHPNVRKTSTPHTALKSAVFRLALWDCIPEQNFWSSAYSVQSVLVQLQAFLLHEDLLYDTTKTDPEVAAEKAHNFECRTCGHKGSCEHPPLPDPNELLARTVRPKLVVSRPFVPARCREAARTLQLHQMTKEQLKQGVKVAKAAVPKPATAQPVAPPSQPKPIPAKPAIPTEDEWVEVKSRKPKPESTNSYYGTSTSKGATKSAPKHSGKAPSIGAAAKGMANGKASAGPSLANGTKPTAAKAPTSTKATVSGTATPPPAAAASGALKPIALADSVYSLLAEISSSDDDEPSGSGKAAANGSGASTSNHFPGMQLSAAAKKNLARREKKRLQKLAAANPEQQQPSASSTPAAGAPGPCTAPTAATPAAPAGTAKVDDGWAVIGGPAKPVPEESPASSLPDLLKAAASDDSKEAQQQLIKLVTADCQSAAAPQAPSSTAESQELPTIPADALPAMSYFGLLGRDAMLAVLCQLAPKDVGCLAATCRGMSAAIGDGELWRSLLRREYPGSVLSASKLADWRHAYLLEASNVVGELQCYFTKATFQEEVLGCPVRFTMNPKTNLIDYIEADADLLSASAFKAGLQPRNGAGERIDTVMPLYLTAQHFSAALPLLPKVLAILAPEQVAPGGRPPSPEAWLDVLPKVLNTCAVLLSDRGMAASQRSLAAFCGLHRLMLALCEHYNLWNVATSRLDRFLAKPENRTKAAVPNLGHLLPLLSISPRHKWPMLARPLLEEVFDRNIIWMCKHAPVLAELLAKPPVAGEVLEELLKESFEGCRVSARLIMFNYGFLHHVACPPGSSLEQVMDTYDSLYGRPGAGLSRRFQAFVQRVLAVDSWAGFFAMLGLAVPSPAYLTAWLKQAWRNSLAKKYHTSNTDFTRIHASGVSKILLKGESYSAPPNIRKIALEEHWRWRETDGTKYLDASCLLYAKDGRMTEAIDYSHTRSLTTKESGAVTHSGDVMDYANHAGTHTIDIDLAKLGDHVASLVITMSSFAGAKLIQIEQPFIKVIDPATQMGLCSYSLEEQPREQRQSKSAIIMCRIQRSARSGGWEVKAIGHICHGYAGSYDPIVSAIRNLA